MNDMKEQLIKLPYWDKLDNRQKESLAHNASIRSYEKGNIIHGCSSTCLGMINVMKGDIRVYMISEEGREITLFRLEEGDPCVLSASCIIREITFDTQMVAENDCELLIISSNDFKRLTDENIYVKCFMYETATERFSSVMWAMQQMLFAKFDQRLATFLLDEYDKTGNSEIRMTHEQIAQQVSSAREVVARMLKRFVSDGLVELKRGLITLKDIDGLRNI